MGTKSAMNSKLALSSLAAVSLLLACPAANAIGAEEAAGVTVRFEFAHTRAAMEVRGFKSLPEAMQMVSEITFVDGPASAHDRYVFRDAGTSEQLLSTNLRGLRATLGR
jgi:hypothetical protein